jgi:hypothetical protein
MSRKASPVLIAQLLIEKSSCAKSNVLPLRFKQKYSMVKTTMQVNIERQKQSAHGHSKWLMITILSWIATVC